MMGPMSDTYLSDKNAASTSREIPESANPVNPLGMDGIEFIEFATSQPQALGAVLQTMGFMPVARHRSREVMLYRQGGMNLIVNAHPDALPAWPRRRARRRSRRSRCACAMRPRRGGTRSTSAPGRCRRAPPRWSSTFPGIHGVGDSRIYFVDRYRDFSIYDVDFVPLPGVDPHPPAIAGLHYFGVVQTIRDDRSADWIDFYHAALRLLGAARRAVLRHPAQGHAAREPVPQVLPAADRAAAGRRGHRVGRAPAAHRPRRARRARGDARRCASAASCSSTATRSSRATRGR